jgi:WD40 repeat protein
LFVSGASNLVAGVYSGTPNLFLRALATGGTYALTTSGFTCAAMTRDGRYVAFAGTPTGKVYLWDSSVGKRIATNFLAYYSINSISISPDGNRVVCFSTGGTNRLIAWDRAANKTWPLAAAYWCAGAGLHFSADSRFLAYAAAPSSGGTNQVYLYDFQELTNVLVSCAAGATPLPADGSSDSPDISADGQFVAYRSAADNIVAGETNGVPEVLLFDATTGANIVLGSGMFGSVSGNNRSQTPVFSGDGGVVVFCSWASDLVAGDFNQAGDLFAFALLHASITATNGACPTISWSAALNQNYIVEYKDELGDATWQPLAGTAMVIGDRAYLTDWTLAADRRFYRVRVGN